MKKIIFLSIVFAVTALCSYNANASGYIANDNLIDEMFTTATETVNISFTDLSLAGNSTTSLAAGEKDAVVAIVLDFFLGGLGVHRFYLGTEVMTGVGYILTCGGIFGIVPLVDFIVLIINMDDISEYVNNPKFFMWN
ncbi:MAG: TM2 domain-containing protein [Bacteroidales bacterium]|nr:TM2 domain-containing protein [Bacteroidales bacterium]MDP3003465.1 TM2 domain-containing protein [Bacteroidales bacterium]